MPERLLGRFQEALRDPELLALDREMALVDARITELLERVSSSEPIGLWKSLSRDWRSFRTALASEDAVGTRTFLASIERTIAAGAGDEATWQSILEAIDGRRKLSEAETKRREKMQQFLAIGEFLAVARALIEAVRANVTDRHALNAIQAEFSRLIGAGAERGPES